MKSFVCCALAWLACVGAAGADDCCARCGCQSSCSKICRLVPDVKKTTKTVYDCECEDFCVPGRSQRCVEHDECGHRKIVYTPTCAEVRTRVKLVKQQKTEKVNTCKWVVEELCPTCAQKCTAQETSAQPSGMNWQGQPVGAAGPVQEFDDDAYTAAPPAGEPGAAAEAKSPLRRALGGLFGRD